MLSCTSLWGNVSALLFCHGSIFDQCLLMLVMLSNHWMLFWCSLWLLGLATFKMFSFWMTLLSLWFVVLTTYGGNFDSTQWLRSFEYFFQTHSLIRLFSSDSTLSLLSVTCMLNWAINICPFVHLSSRFFFSNEMPDSSVFVHENISFRLKVATTSV